MSAQIDLCELREVVRAFLQRKTPISQLRRALREAEASCVWSDHREKCRTPTCDECVELRAEEEK